MLPLSSTCRLHPNRPTATSVFFAPKRSIGQRHDASIIAHARANWASCDSRVQRVVPSRQPLTCSAASKDGADTEEDVQYLSDDEVDELISDAAGFICVLDELRPLDSAAYNPFWEVWTRIARIPPEERPRLLEELEPGCLRSLWKASVGRYVLDEGRSRELFGGGEEEEEEEEEGEEGEGGGGASIWDDFP
ncbi:hypothetical protein Agub_g4259, partial [Astrephomene gubernaculifera]